MEFDELSNQVIGCALEVHRNLGPGLLESTYEQCLAYEMKLAGMAFKLQYPLPVKYKGIKLDGLVKSSTSPLTVIPAKAGIQSFQAVADHLDSGFHRSDDFLRIH